MPLEQAVLAHQSLGIVDTADGPRTRVVLVAARRDVVERFHAAARAAGLRPVGIDLSAFAMIRALHDGSTGATLYVSVGGMTNLALAEGTHLRLHARRRPAASRRSPRALAERRGLTLDHARQWLTHVGLETPLEQVDGDAEIVEEARSVPARGRPPDRRRGAQLARLPPRAGRRARRRAGDPHRPRRRDPRLLRAARRRDRPAGHRRRRRRGASGWARRDRRRAAWRSPPASRSSRRRRASRQP